MKPCLVSLVTVLVGAAAALGADIQVSNTTAVAVVDFELAGGRADAKDWAFGLADVLAVELRQRGVVLFERQQIRVVLGERQITASGLMQLPKMPAQGIPDLQYLVTGSIRPLTNQQFHLEASLVEARTGRNAASFAREGQYPKALPGALAALAGQLAVRLSSTGTAAPPGQAAGRGPTRAPEAILPFYKGVACCLAGQPELGVTWFLDTPEAGFLPARVWTMRAFEMLGLPDFAAIARAKVLEAPNGQGVLNHLNESRLMERRLVSVLVIPDPRLDAAGLQFSSALKAALGHYTNLFVADSSNIRSLAAEMDLQLTENGAHDLESTSLLWSTVDALALVRRVESPSGGMISVELDDALSGETLFSTQTARDGSGLPKLGRDLAARLAARGKASSPGHLGVTAGNTRTAKPVQISNVDRNEFAGLLKYLADNPADRDAWARLALFVCWLGGVEDGRYQCAIADRIVAATDLNEPDAARWLSIALWHRRRHEHPQSLAVEAATLFERYPNSPEAQYARSVQALEYVDQKKYAEAAAILLKLNDDMPRLESEVKIGPDYRANLYFFTGAVLRELGEVKQANAFFERADEVFSKNPEMPIADVGMYGVGVWRNHFPIRHPLFGPDRDLRQAVTEWKMHAQPQPLADGGKMTLEQLEVTLTQARLSWGQEARAQRVAFLQRLIEHKQSHPELYQGRVTDSIWQGPYRKVEVWRQGTSYGNFTLQGKLVMEAIFLLGQLAADSPQEIAETRRLASALADRLDAPVAANCFEAVGEPERALQKVEQAIANPTPFPPLSTAMHPTREQTEAKGLRRQKIRLLQALGRPAEVLAYARSQAQLPQPDADAQLAATLDAAEVCVGAGRSDEGCQLLAEFVRKRETAGTMISQTAAARLWQAEYETARGNNFEASELLRSVIQQSEGKGWGVYLRTGYAKAYDAAVSRLVGLRVFSQFPIISTDWEKARRPAGPAAAPVELERSEMGRDLEELLRGTSSGPTTTSYGGSKVDVFIKKYGHSAVPTLLEAAGRQNFSAQLIASLGLLERTARPEDAPQVLEAFKTSPRLAQTAFRLDQTNAAVILRERFSVYARGGEIPREVLQVLEKYSLRDQYPVLIANFAAKDLNGNTAPNSAAIDRMLRQDPAPEVLQQFRHALASVLQKQLLSTYRYGLDSLGEVALRNGVPEGIEALLRSGSPVPTNGLARLRKYIDLPADDAAALAAVQAGLGRWQWEAGTGRFVLGKSATAQRATSPADNKGP